MFMLNSQHAITEDVIAYRILHGTEHIVSHHHRVPVSTVMEEQESQERNGRKILAIHALASTTRLNVLLLRV
jgi:hypothetical protein